MNSDTRPPNRGLSIHRLMKLSAEKWPGYALRLGSGVIHVGVKGEIRVRTRGEEAGHWIDDAGLEGWFHSEEDLHETAKMILAKPPWKRWT